MPLKSIRTFASAALRGTSAVVLSVALAFLWGCGNASAGSSAAVSGGASAQEGGSTSGPAYSEPTVVEGASFDAAAAQTAGPGAIDVSNAASGYAGAMVVSQARCKLQVMNGDMSYNYDLPSDGAPIIVPLNMGDGAYTLRIMQNTSGSNYVEVGSVSANVSLSSLFAPFLHPNVFCEYTSTSSCVKKAFELAAPAQNEGDVVRAVYEWIVGAIEYDTPKASQLASTTGYIPDPDETFSSGYGICFDYASLAAAMFRSLGIPCQIVTGYVEPDNLYHAWNMVYIDGQWVSAEITVDSDEWCRIDLTFAAADGSNQSYTGSGTSYTDRYIY